MPAGDILLGNERIAVRDDSRDPPLERAPDGVRRAARLLDALTMDPQDGYFRDLAVFLGFRMARSELDTARSSADTEIAADILWRTALRAEYGGAADARRALEEAQRALNEALAQHAPPERIRQLMQALREATSRYMQALVQQALRNGQRQNMEDTQDQTQISQRDIEAMMQQVQQLSEQGRTAEAQALLQQLSQILANLDVRLSQQPQQGGDGSQQQQMQQDMDRLADTMGQQRALRDDTQQQQSQQQQGGQQQQQQQQSQQQQGQQQNAQGGGRGSRQGGQGGQGGQDLADRQSHIRQSLSDAQRQSSETGAANRELDAAGRAMQQSEQALRAGDLRGAEAAQNSALDHLREGASQLSARMREGQGAGSDPGAQDQQNGQSSDPLGRALSEGGAGDQNMRIRGSLSSQVRARELFDEIRRRAEDPNRPEAEREYLRRLLDTYGGS
jgi:uncharacterized protein (TIGR02302 family)